MRITKTIDCYFGELKKELEKLDVAVYDELIEKHDKLDLLDDYKLASKVNELLENSRVYVEVDFMYEYKDIEKPLDERKGNAVSTII